MAEKEEKVKINKKTVDTTKKLTEELFKLMSVDAQIDVSEDKENEAVRVDIESEDATGLLIGSRGDTLRSIQSVLGMMLRQELNGWVRVIVNIGDWREKKEEYLKNLARQAAEKAKDTGEDQPLYNLKPAERRIVHMEIADIEGVESVSEGEGEERYLIIKTS